MKKKHIKYFAILFMVLPMSIIMALVGVLRIYGFCANWYILFAKSWCIMFPVAYLSAFLFSPIAKQLAEKLEAKFQ